LPVDLGIVFESKNQKQILRLPLRMTLRHSGEAEGNSALSRRLYKSATAVAKSNFRRRAVNPNPTLFESREAAEPYSRGQWDSAFEGHPTFP
jgi:hypothetical protein